MLEQTGFKFEPIESVVRSCINWAIKRACSSLLYTCIVKHHYYPSIHKVWKVCYDLTVLNYRYTKLFQKKKYRYKTETSFITLFEAISVNFFFITKYIKKSKTPCCQTIGKMPQFYFHSQTSAKTRRESYDAKKKSRTLKFTFCTKKC